MKKLTRFGDTTTMGSFYLLCFGFRTLFILIFFLVLFICRCTISSMKIQEAEEYANQAPRIENLNLELTKQTLNTMLDGLTKIKDQLNSVAVQ